ncbi:MAG: ABC transporter permease [Acidimicrobiales bacterium]|jgi:ABC-type polysaccharide/polyol phosphate export permease
MTDLAVDQSDNGRGLVVTDVASIGAEPPDDILYTHKAPLVASLRSLWVHREIMYTLAERDFRAQYKQAALGVAWAVLSPVLTLAIFVLVFSRLKGSIHTQGIPFALFEFVGILCWSFFSSALGTGGISLLTNKALLAKTQFPRECFPLETMLVNGLNTVISWIPLAILFVYFGRAPKIATVWVPLFILIEVAFAAGITLAISSLIIQMRDLQQVLPIIISLGIFMTPVIWPFSMIPAHFHVYGGTLIDKHWVGGFYVNLQVVYGFFNPLGPVINSIRQTMLLGHNPSWLPLGAAVIGSMVYLVGGYKIFKRYEVNFADIA